MLRVRCLNLLRGNHCWSAIHHEDTEHHTATKRCSDQSGRLTITHRRSERDTTVAKFKALAGSSEPALGDTRDSPGRPGAQLLTLGQ